MSGKPQRNEPTPARSSKATWIALVGIALVAVVYLFLGPGRLGGPSGRDHPAVGTKLEHLELSPLTATETPLPGDEPRGKVVLMNFWGTWCPPCRAEFPHLMELRRKLSSNDSFQFVSVSCRGTVDLSRGETVDSHLQALRSDTQKFLDQRNVQLTTYADPLGRARQQIATTTNLDSFAFPTTLLLDREGVIRGMWVGFREGDEKEMESLTREVLNESPGSPS